MVNVVGTERESEQTSAHPGIVTGQLQDLSFGC